MTQLAMESQTIAEVYKFCPRCATENSEPGAVPFKCVDCGFSNYFSPVAAVGGIVVNEAGEMLFIRRSRDPGKGKWGLPGGFVDPNESGEQAVAREVYEEVGLEVTGTSYLMSHPNQYNYRGIVSPVIDLFYLVEVKTLDGISLALDEVDYYEWSIPSNEHLDNMAFHSNRLAVEHWMGSKS
ncbi:MAG: NUDIX domain-containing protein [Planctomycetota bacterium]